MKKRNIIKKNTDYQRIIQTTKPFRYKEFIIYKEKIDDPSYYFGFSVSKKICNAVVRNKLRRQIKDILDQKNYQNGFNCIIMVRKGILDISYQTMRENLFYCLEKINVLKENKHEEND